MNFPGFPEELPEYFAALKANNNRDWFEENRERYETVFLEPAKQFVQAMDARLDDLYPGLNAVPKINGSIRRLNRDTRFGRDKSPYHDHLHLIFWKGAKATTAPGFHLVISAEHVGFGTGMWMFSDTELARYCEVISHPSQAAALRDVIAKASMIDGQSLDTPALKRVPKGYEDAPDPDLLRHKGVVVRGDLFAPKTLFTDGAIEYTLDLFATQVPLLAWLDTQVAQA